MRKTLFSVLPLFVFLGPTFARIPLLPGWFFLRPPVKQAADAAPRRDSEEAATERMRARIKEARRALEASPADSLNTVTLAVAPAEGEAGVHTLRLPKQDFITKDAELSARSSMGETLRLRVVRPNYVNTAVRVTDAHGRELQPLLVRYPIEKGGSLKEVAYYSSAHPATGGEELVRAGGEYIHEKLNAAAARLALKGKRISPEIVDAAERLCIVEHTDHKRFLSEDRGSIFREVLTLYALNSGDTYRYSVSSAGAGGMVQMIPPTYQAMRRLHPEVGLEADFVTGMRDHSNALEAMLLYMQDTWDDLLDNEEVVAALSSGVATQEELLAAGYNSNPLRLPRYLRQGGHGWRQLIPEETQMYLRIYASVESLVDFKNRG